VLTHGRHYSDDECEEEEFYDRESTLMGVARAHPGRSQTVPHMSAAAPAPKLSVPKVINM